MAAGKNHLRTFDHGGIIVLIASRSEDDDMGALGIYMRHRHLAVLTA